MRWEERRMAHRIFISSSSAPEDELLRRKLETHLSTPAWRALVTLRREEDIHAGDERLKAVRAELEAADVILLLISPEYLASDELSNVHLKTARERLDAGTAVVPILARKCSWWNEPLATLQCLPRSKK